MFWTTLSIQIWDHAYATVGNGWLVDRFATCNVCDRFLGIIKSCHVLS